MNQLKTGKNCEEVECEESIICLVDVFRNNATLTTLANIPVCLCVSVPSNLCKHWNHTCLSIFPCTLQPLQPLQPYLCLSLYLATFATFRTIPVCLSVSVPRNVCKSYKHIDLFICLCTSQPLQPFQPYLSVYMSLYLATFSILANVPSVCPRTSQPLEPLYPYLFSMCLCTLQPLEPLRSYMSVYLSLYVATFETLATISVVYLSLSTLQPYLSVCLCTSQPLEPLQ